MKHIKNIVTLITLGIGCGFYLQGSADAHRSPDFSEENEPLGLRDIKHESKRLAIKLKKNREEGSLVDSTEILHFLSLLTDWMEKRPSIKTKPRTIETLLTNKLLCLDKLAVLADCLAAFNNSDFNPMISECLNTISVLHQEVFSCGVNLNGITRIVDREGAVNIRYSSIIHGYLTRINPLFTTLKMPLLEQPVMIDKDAEEKSEEVNTSTLAPNSRRTEFNKLSFQSSILAESIKEKGEVNTLKINNFIGLINHCIKNKISIELSINGDKDSFKEAINKTLLLINDLTILTFRIAHFTNPDFNPIVAKLTTIISILHQEVCACSKDFKHIETSFKLRPFKKKVGETYGVHVTYASLINIYIKRINPLLESLMLPLLELPDELAPKAAAGAGIATAAAGESD